MALTLVASNDRKMTMEVWIKLVKVGEKKLVEVGEKKSLGCCWLSEGVEFVPVGFFGRY